ncbi:hypothetical protein K5M76_06500 [Shewanella xiamenensis]|uniref:hypothetical protein n=1 Tax=Shewanella xiamenensis TaxID=332186 RepID=UPI00217E6FE4|nr:hypothetical protein [Shewanella xiamenensis]MCT8858326.1 hypothetical protein [Shewanella xiamenensis]UWG65872.1 hypothetical protein K5M76_06500 [Shewanella xiamenensis]
MSDNQAIIELKQGIQSEISNFFESYKLFGEPASPEAAQQLLMGRIEHRFAKVSKKETKQEGFSREAGQALSNLSISSLDGIRHYVDYRNHEIKRYLQELEVHLEGVDYGRYEASQKEVSNLDNLSMVLSREVERVAGI